MNTILLTPRLATLRIRARENFPDAEWLPGDECPVGARVIRRDGYPATVLGPAKSDLNEWWWLLRDDRYPYEVLEWPPTLRWMRPRATPDGSSPTVLEA